MNDTATRLLAIFVRRFGALETPEQEPLDAQIVRDLKPDSLDLVELVMDLEDEFQVTISDDEAADFAKEASIRDVLKMVEVKLAMQVAA
jgi:acyl carrier protein